LFSILFLKKKLTPLHWLGIAVVVSGLVVVGVSDLLFDKTPQGNHTGGEKVVGILLILLAMIFTSLQV
jgi:drug/metabolite transporter (DMT)-like permease